MTNFQAMLFSKSLQAKLMNIAMSKTFNVPDAEDLVQTTYVKAIERQDQFSGEIIDPWIVRILQNTFIDSTRKGKFTVPNTNKAQEKKRVKGEVSLGDDTPEYAVEDPSQAAMAERDLEMCMKELNEIEREVVAMKQTMSYEEIAVVLDIKAASARVKLCRAKEKLMICMGVSND